jgi:hypothetical protein
MPTKLIKRAIILSIAVFAILLAGLCGYTTWQAYRCRKSAEALLSDLRRMKVGEATLADVQQLARTHSRFLNKGDPFRLDEWLRFSFLYDNYDGDDNYVLQRIRLWRLDLWRFHLAPEDCAFSVIVDVHRDRLERITMGLSSDVMPRTFSATVDDEVPEISPHSQSYVEGALPQQISIYIKPNATPAQREYAYSFNLKCMDKIGGCRDKSELLRGPSPR